MRIRVGLAVVLLSAALLPGSLRAQANATITGVVTDQRTGEPLPSVQVFLSGSTRGTITNDDGRYLMTGVAPGQYEVRASLIGYSQAEPKTVTATAGQTSTVDFALVPSAVQLGAVIVTATGERQSKREIGNSIGTIDIDRDISLSAVNDVSQVLQGRTAGVSVLSASGTSGTGQRIRIRGSNSVSLSNDPLLVVDGVRADNSTSSVGVGGQNLNRLNDINPEDIESIEILKGPAASAMYGTAAANGVIVVTTKKGIGGTTRFRAYSEYGTVQDITDYPANYRGFCSIDTPTGRATFGYCDIGTLGDPGLASRNITLDSVVSFNPLEDPRSTPFEDGARRKFGLSASGGSDQVTFFVSGDIDEEDGLYKYDLSRLDRKGARANIQAQLLDELDLTVNTGYVRSDAKLPQNDNNALGVVSGALLSSQIRYDSVSAGFGFGITPEQISLIGTTQEVARLTTSVTAEWRPISWLGFIGTAGMDRVTVTDGETVPPGQVPYSSTLLEGSRFISRGTTAEYTANGGGNATFQLASDLVSTTSAGVQYNEQLVRSSSAFGALLLPGVPSLEGANARFSVGENNFQVRTIGGYVQQKLDWRNRVFVAAALRADDNSAFGNDFGLAYYPSASVSWVVAEEPFFPDIEALSTLRLRAAAGRSGLRPGVLDAFRFFNPVAVSQLQGSTPGFTIGGAGNPNLRPEKVTEFEAGFDAGLINDRIGLEFTWYRRESEDALVSRRLPPSLGISTTRRENLGSVENTGVEGLLTARILEMPDVQWEATITASRTRNELTDLGIDPVTGEPLPPIIFGLGGSSQRHQEGYPLGAYFFRPYTFADENGDGLIIADEIEFTADTAVYMGSPFPTREASLSSGLTLFDIVRVSGMLDYRGGYKLYNSSEEFRCGSFLNCETIYNPDAPLAEQARAIEILYFGNGTGYLEDASFLKLRELSLSFMVPDRYAGRIGSEALSITLSGRNLATWTDYTGLDPEINFAGSGSNFTTAEFLTQPPARYFTARVDVTF